MERLGRGGVHGTARCRRRLETAPCGLRTPATTGSSVTTRTWRTSHESRPTGTGPGQFKGPVGIVASPSSGRVYVTDSGNHRIQVLDKNGEYLTEYDVPWLDKTWQVHLEIGPGRDPLRELSRRVRGPFLQKTGEAGPVFTTDDAGEKLGRPVGLGLDRKGGILYVMDTANQQVLKVALPQPKGR